MKRKTTLLLLTLVLVLSLFGCAQNAAEPAPESGTEPEAETSETQPEAEAPEPAEESNMTAPGEFPIVKEKINLRIMIPISAEHAMPIGDLDMIKEYEEKTNIHVEWDQISDQAYAETYKLVLASNDLPDAFGSESVAYDSNTIFRYGQQGLIVPLEGIIEEVGINTKKYFNEREDFRKLCTYPDGHIYALPKIDENQNLRVDSQLWVNQTYLDALGMEKPQTYDEIGDYLRAITTQDLNGDGQNEYGLSFENAIRLTYLFGAFGVSWDAGNFMNQTKDGSGPLQFAPSMDETRQALEYFSGWYQEGLIDSEIFTQNAQTLKAKAKEQGIGLSLVLWSLNLNDGDETKNAYHVLNMPQNNEGTATWRRNGAMPGLLLNQFFITSANEYPRETLRYIDYWLDNGELALTNRFGPQGYSWDYVESGKWTELANIPTGEPRTMANSTLKCTWAFGIPYWQFADLWANKEITAPVAIERQDGLNAPGSYVESSTMGLPELTYDEADTNEAMEIKTDLFDYVTSQVARFITEGVTDDSWNEYLDRLNALRADRWTELYNKYYEIYNQ